jgi:hypothetical protein
MKICVDAENQTDFWARRFLGSEAMEIIHVLLDMDVMASTVLRILRAYAIIRRCGISPHPVCQNW